MKLLTGVLWNVATSLGIMTLIVGAFLLLVLAFTGCASRSDVRDLQIIALAFDKRIKNLESVPEPNPFDEQAEESANLTLTEPQNKSKLKECLDFIFPEWDIDEGVRCSH